MKIDSPFVVRKHGVGNMDMKRPESRFQTLMRAATITINSVRFKHRMAQLLCLLLSSLLVWNGAVLGQEPNVNVATQNTGTTQQSPKPDTTSKGEEKATTSKPAKKD